MYRLLLPALTLLPTLTTAALPPYSSQLIKQAHAQRLGHHPEWLALGHYLPAGDSGTHISLADSKNFFNAVNGKQNPQAELEATIKSLFVHLPEGSGEQHPQCRFIARYQWLKQKLAIDPALLPKQPCTRFRQWIEAIAPSQITLIFPVAYLNNPSSMFGHTLLRIDQPEQTERTRLFSYAINYAAQTDETSGLTFALRGLTGGYSGGFSIMPYYEKVKEYSDLENRDIWEYQLNLTTSEIRRLLEHIWELGPIRFDYYFFDENCSYHLLGVLDVARPGMELAKKFPAWAIPSDTVRTIIEQEGLLKKAIFRPSQATRLRHQIKRLSRSEQQLAHQLANSAIIFDHSPLQRLPNDRRALVLETAYGYLQYRFHTESLPRQSVSRRSLELLASRSDLGNTSINLPPIAAPDARPDQGHLSSRIAIEGGRQWDRTYTSIKVRPAYHDLIDPVPGYIDGAQINLFDLAIRHYMDTAQGTRLEELALVNIISLSPRDIFFSPLSWSVAVGARRLPPFLHPVEPLAAYIEGGIGPSYRLGNSTLFSLMLEGAWESDSQLSKGYASTLGGNVSVLLTGPINVRAIARRGEYLHPHTRSWAEYRLETGIAIADQISLRATAALIGEPQEPEQQASLSLHWYF